MVSILAVRAHMVVGAIRSLLCKASPCRMGRNCFRLHDKVSLSKSMAGSVMVLSVVYFVSLNVVARTCGMQALGVAVELSPASVSSCIEQTHLGFMYAPYYHPVMKSVKSVRSALQVRQAAAGAVLHAWTAL